MNNEFTREQTLQLKYPVGTKGKIRPSDYRADFLRTKGWTPETVVSVESAYVSGAGYECLVVRWGRGINRSSMIKVKEFKSLEAIALVSELAGIEKWFEEGRQAAVQGQDRIQCPYDFDHQSQDEYLWWNRGYKFADRSARLIVAEQFIKKLTGDRTSD